jgi:hypothetical protein
MTKDVGVRALTPTYELINQSSSQMPPQFGVTPVLMVSFISPSSDAFVGLGPSVSL